MTSKVDLHVHSRFSNRSPEWLLRRFDVPDSYTDPRKLHALLRERGMDFVTITDHDRIDGCLEIADLPGVVHLRAGHHMVPGGSLPGSSSRLGPHRGPAPRHLTRSARTSTTSRNISRRKTSPMRVAHPLYRLDEKFSRRHVERLLLLFRHFEGLNGLRDALLSELHAVLLGSLTPAQNRGIRQQPGPRADPSRAVDKSPHRRLGRPRRHLPRPRRGARLPRVANVRGTARASPRRPRHNPRRRRHAARPLARRLQDRSTPSSAKNSRAAPARAATCIEKVFSRFMEGRDPTEFSFAEKMSFLAQGIVTGKIFELAKPMNASLWKQFADDLLRTPISRDRSPARPPGIAEPERRAFIMANSLANQVAFRVFTRFVKEISTGNLMESIQDISALTPILIALAPTFTPSRARRRTAAGSRASLLPITGAFPPPCKTGSAPGSPTRSRTSTASPTPSAK